MSVTSMPRRWHYILPTLLLLTFLASYALARDAAFVDPGAPGGNSGDEAVKVDPKGDIDTGESVVNVARRTTLFFVNQSAGPVQIENISVNNDGNVKAEITNDDCSKQGTLAAQSRCSVEITVTPISSGPWTVETLLTHNGAGRIARAKLLGKTTGATTTADKKDTGLSFSSKEVSPINFGDVEIGTGKAVRSALMVNDSPETITLYAIDVIAAENGLERLDQGCVVDMELKPGESCPVTLVWQPVSHGQISTDLIIRHSGRLGFAVIPIRGAAKGNDVVSDKDSKSGDTKSAGGDKKDSTKSNGLPPPPTPEDIEKASLGKIPPVSSSALPMTSQSAKGGDGKLHLIGTVGNRAVILKPDETTAVVGVGDDLTWGDDTAKVKAVTPKSVTLVIDGKDKVLMLGSSPELIAKAEAQEQARLKSSPTSSTGSSTSSSSTTSSSPTPPSKPASMNSAPLSSALSPTTSPGSAFAGGLK